MKRDIERDLISWKTDVNRMPLLVRGARQVGKSYIVEKFAKENFKSYVLINFEQYPEFKKAFQTLDPSKIVQMLELVSNKSIVVGHTLLFLDEIQECPQAIMALRYFKEQMPLLHVIGAGSLLEFTLNDPNFRMPVGRIQSLFLRPLSFGEFLEAVGSNKLREFLQKITIKDVIEPLVHQTLLDKVKLYASLGGMPAVLMEYLQTGGLLKCQDIQSDILLTYRKDFGKYATKTKYEVLEMLFTKIPGHIGEWIKYSKLSENIDIRLIKSGLKNLNDAGIINLVYATSAAGLPLIAHMNEKKAKMFFLDTGLVKRAYNLDIDLIQAKELSLVNAGMLAEQYVGQELLAYSRKEENNSLFFWVREDKSSGAEVDFVISVDQYFVPLEVKAASIGSLKSLKIFQEEKKVGLGLRVSELPFALTQKVLSVPFYLIEKIPDFIREFYKN